MMDDQTVPLEIVEPSVHSLDMSTEMSVVCGGTKEGWTPVAAVVLWTRMLGILGNVNDIESAKIHAEVLTALSEIWHLLAKVCESGNFSLSTFLYVQESTRIIPIFKHTVQFNVGRGMPYHIPHIPNNSTAYHTIPYHTIPYHTILYYTILYYTIPYYTIPYHTIPYHTIPYHTIPYHTVPYRTILYYTILYHTIPYHTILYHTIPYHTIPYHTIPYRTILYYTILYYTTPYHTIPYHTIPYHTIPYCTVPCYISSVT